MTKRFYVLALLALSIFVAFSCSRKEDDELPARSGDLKVWFKVSDQFGVLADTVNIPVILSIYTDTTHSRLVRSESMTVRNHVTMAVTFEELEPRFMSLTAIINQNAITQDCPDLSVFIRESLVTETDVIELEVLGQEIRCNY